MKTTVCWEGDTYDVELIEASSPYDKLWVGHVGHTGLRIELRRHADVLRDFWTAVADLRSRDHPLSGVVEIRSSGGEYRQHAVDEMKRIVEKLDHLSVIRPQRSPVDG